MSKSKKSFKKAKLTVLKVWLKAVKSKIAKMTTNCHNLIVLCQKTLRSAMLAIVKHCKALKPSKSIKKLVDLLFLAIFCVSASLSADQLHMVWLEAKVGENTLFIKGNQGSGTAFEVKAASGKVYTITNAHVCELADSNRELQVFDKKNSKRLIPVKIIEIDDVSDLCVLTGLPGYSGLSLGTKTVDGDGVIAFGYPKGEALNIAKGRVKAEVEIEIMTSIGACTNSGTTKYLMGMIAVCVSKFKTIATDVSIFPGNSGGPLVNKWGNVVGVVSAADNTTHWGFAVRLVDLETLISAY